MQVTSSCVAGKTTILRALLSQNKFKIGCVVNDVAAVNIDAKLIRNQNSSDKATSTSDLAPTIELQNGCACATPSFGRVSCTASGNPTSEYCTCLTSFSVAPAMQCQYTDHGSGQVGHPGRSWACFSTGTLGPCWSSVHPT